MREDCFPNLAGVPDIDDQLIAELEAAGLEYIKAEWILNRDLEVKTSVLGGYNSWSFTRHWYYWSAEGPGIPPSYANKLYETKKMSELQVIVDARHQKNGLMDLQLGTTTLIVHLD